MVNKMEYIVDMIINELHMDGDIITANGKKYLSKNAVLINGEDTLELNLKDEETFNLLKEKMLKNEIVTVTLHI